jgi:DNA repair exonuclease SbcCD ATPase subunit
VLVEGRNTDSGSSNESGKSTLFNALCWCLYGRWPGGPAKPGDEIVNPLDKHDCIVQVEILNGKEKVTIKRTRMEGKAHKDSKLYITLNGETKEHDLRQQDKSASTDWVSEYLGLNYEAFLKQRYFAQEDIAPVTRMKSTALKQFCLENLLDIQWVHRALENVRNDISKIKALALNVQYAREGDLRQLISRHEPLLQHKKKVKEWEDEELHRQVRLAEELQEAVQMFGEAQKINKKVEKQVLQIDKKFAKRETDLQKTLKAIKVSDDVDFEVDQLHKQYSRAEADEAAAESSIKKLAARKETLEGKIKGTESQIGQRCENCGTILTKKHLPWFIKETATEIDSVKTSIQEREEGRASLKDRSKSIWELLSEAKRKREDQRELREAQANVRVEIAKLQGAKLREIATLKEDLIDVPTIEKEMRRIATDQAQVKENPYIELIAKEKKEIKRLSQSMRSFKAKTIEHEESMKIAKVWENAFSSKIQAWLLDDITNVINRFIAGYMMDLADGRISARLHTVKKLKTGDYREEFGILIKNMDGGDSFASLSGGAKSRVDIAVSLAIADFQRALSHKQLDFLVLDEVASFLDVHWREKLYKLLKKRFSNISCYVITHESIDYIDFDRVVTVVKKDGITSIGA